MIIIIEIIMIDGIKMVKIMITITIDKIIDLIKNMKKTKISNKKMINL